MASKSAVLSIRVVSDAKGAQKGMDSAATSVDKLEQNLDKMSGPAAVAMGALALVGDAAIDSASRVEQSSGGVEAVFKKQADAIKAYADGASQNLGLAKSDYQELATVIGSQLKNAGTPMDELAGSTDDLISKGADLAAMFGGTTSDAVGALSSLLKGERDPIEAYGVSINQAAIDAQLAAMGMDDLTGAAAKQAETQATLALLTEQTADATGAFARETDTAAGAEARANAEMENTRAALGESLLPLYSQFQELLGTVAVVLANNSDLVVTITAVVAAFAAGILVLNGALKAWRAAIIAVTAVTKLWRVAQIALNLAMRANPIGIVITIIAALVAIIVKLWKENEGFRNFFINAWNIIKTTAQIVWRAIKQAVVTVVSAIMKRVRSFKDAVATVWEGIQRAGEVVWEAIQDAGEKALEFLLSPIEAVQSAFDAVWDVIESVISAIARIVFPSMPGWMRDLGGAVGFSTFAAPLDEGLAARSLTAESDTTQQLVAPATFGSPSSLSSMASNSNAPQINVTVQGALDPIGTARTIERVVGKNMRRTGRRTMGQVVFQ